jgi:DNA-binding winged helix-turn-helix (wHTH) protein/class 3 adenylate cyclase
MYVYTATSAAGCLAIDELRDTSMIYGFGDYELDTQLFELRCAGTPLKLEPKVFDLLAHLIRHHDRVVTKQELFAHLWPERFISAAVLDYCIMAARKAVGDSGRRQRVIKTVRGRGYRFVAATEERVTDAAGSIGLVAREAPSHGEPQLHEPDGRVARAGWSAEPSHAPASPSLSPAEREPAEGPFGHQDNGMAVPTGGETWATEPAWEQKPVAVLAIDVAFPEAMDSTIPYDDPWTVCMRWQQAIAATIQGFGGLVVRHALSPLIAIFGLPHTLEQMPQRAVQAALATRHLIEGGLPDECKPGPALRMAVHVGHVLVDIQARDPMARLLALRETLSLPVRLLGRAAPGDIVLAPKVGQLVEGWFELQRCAAPRVARASSRKGAHKVLGLGPKRSPLEVHGKRPLSRFVGREREMAILRDLLRQVEKGRGEVVGVVGEPGVGKSRLCYELTQLYRPYGWLILESSPVAYGKDTPYLPIVDLLKIYFQVDPRDEVRTVGDKAVEKLGRLDIGLWPTLSAVLALLNVPVEDPEWQALEPRQRRQHTLDAVKRMLLRESQAQPLLLVVENLHWIDSETQAFLDSLVESLPTARMMLLVNHRPEYHHHWGSKTYYTQLRLDPLPPKRADELLRALLGESASLEPLKQLVIGKTEGNPFFVEESVRTLVESQVLVGERGAYHLVQTPQTIQVPATVQAILATRIDRLPPVAKHLLQCAAVIGREGSLPLLQAIAEMAEDDLQRGLAHLQTAEFVYETGLFAERAYTFKHAMTHDVAYSSLPQERCRLLHARIVAALEQRHAGRLAEQIERLALHAFRGTVWDKAVTYGQQGGPGPSTVRRSARRQHVTIRPWPRSDTSPRPRIPEAGPSISAWNWWRAHYSIWASMRGCLHCSGKPRPWHWHSTISPG